jgi:cytidylate kinase
MALKLGIHRDSDMKILLEADVKERVRARLADLDSRVFRKGKLGTIAEKEFLDAWNEVEADLRQETSSLTHSYRPEE